MAKYTIELNQILKTGYDLGLSPSDYPFYDETKRVAFNNKLLDHYRWYEIGCETHGRFKFNLNSALSEIMPFYNQLYESALLEIKPLIDYYKKVNSSKATKQDIDNKTNVGSVTNQTDNSKITNDLKNSQTSKNETNLNDKDFNIEQDTPQSGVTDVEIEGNFYASKVNKNDKNSISNSEGISSSTDTGTIDTVNASNNNLQSNALSVTVNDGVENITLTEEGFNTSQTELLKRYRETILNIDVMAIEDKKIRNCFMLLW